MAVGVIKAQVVFQLGARTLTLDYKRVPFSAWTELKKAADLTQKTLLDAIGDADLGAIYALIWLERTQRERNLRYATVVGELSAADDDFRLIRLVVDGQAFGEQEDDAEPGEEETDPTGGS